MDKVYMYVDGVAGRGGTWYPTHVMQGDGSERTQIAFYRVGRHNWTGKRFDMWWKDAAGAVWHGVHMGDMNTVVHARKTRYLTLDAVR